VSGDVRLRDGVRFDLSTGETVVCDAERPDGDINVVSHAHGDHLYDDPPAGLLCSATTAALARARRSDAGGFQRVDHPAVDLLPSGHVPGSRAALVTDPGDGTRYLYTGDVSTRDRRDIGLEGFDPPPADELVVESTYGKPGYAFPDQATLERRIVDFLDGCDRPVLLFGYALGRAQELLALLERSERSRPYVTRAIDRITGVLAEECGADFAFGTRRYGEDDELGADDALVLPARTSRLSFVERIAETTGAVKVGFSGWAVEDSYRFRAGYDEAFVLSDHCDHPELLALVDAVDPERVYTTHGFTDELAAELGRRGYDARALKRDQTTLGEF